MDLIKESLGSEDDKQKAKLLETLRHSPLALRQAIAYIGSRNEELEDKTTGFKINDFLQEYEKKRLESLNLEHIKEEEDKATYLTTQLIIDQINNVDQAIEIINIVSYFASSDVPLSMFSSMIQDEDKLQRLIKLLDKYLIIRFNEKQKVFRVNWSVQVTVRGNAATQEESILEKALTLFADIDRDNVYHAMSVWKHAEKYDGLVRKYHGLASEIINIVYNYLSSYQEALTFGEKVLKVLTKILGFNHLGTLKFKNDLAIMMSSQGQTQEALCLLKENAELLKQYPDIYLINQHNIALTLSVEGKLSEALAVFQQVYDERKDILGPKDSDILITRGHIAILKFHLNHSSGDDSIAVLREIVKELNEPCDEGTLALQHNIGFILNQIGRSDEALEILQEVHQTKKMFLGEDHPLTTKTYREIGITFLNKGENEKASRICKQVYKKQERILGPDHSETLDTRFALELLDALAKDAKDLDITKLLDSFNIETMPALFNQSFDLMNKFRKAMDLHERNRHRDALSLLESVLKDESPSCGPLKSLARKLIANVTCDMADKLNRMGRYQEALATLKGGLSSLMISNGDETEILVVKGNIALTFLELGQYQESFTIFNEVIQKQKKLLGLNHIATLSAQSNFARVLDRLNKFEESLSLYREVIDKLKKTQGVDNSLTLVTQHNMAVVLMKTHKYGEAYKLLNEVLEKRKRISGLNDPETLMTQNNLAKVLYLQKNYNKSLDLFQEVFSKRKGILGLNHPHTLVTQIYIANVFTSQERYSEALEIFNDVFERQKLVLGYRHPDTLMSEQSIEMLKVKMLSASFAKRKTPAKSNNVKFHHAINSGNLNDVNNFLSGGFDVTQVTVPKGNTPLHIATLKGDNKIVESILRYAKQQLDAEKLSDFINAQTTSGKSTSLHVAAQKGYLDVTRTLLKHGAMYNLKNKEKKLPVDLVTNENILNLLKLIGELFEETEHGKGEVIDRLSKLRKDEFLAVTNARNNRGHTLLQVKLALPNKYKDVAAGLSQLIRERTSNNVDNNQ